jgi:hypothetical protein
MTKPPTTFFYQNISPSTEISDITGKNAFPRPAWSRFFPRAPGPSIALSAFISAGLGVLTVLLGVYVFREYALALFCGAPFAMGILAPLLHGAGAPRSFGSLFLASLIAQLSLLAGMLIFAIEGIFCVLMAAPLWLAIALLGTAVALPLHRAMWRNHLLSRGFPVLVLALLCFTPLWMGAEYAGDDRPDQWVMSTAIDIDAPPQTVWQHVVAFPDLPPPGWNNGGWLFKCGIARPIRAEIDGSGVGATRYCVFSTGRATEPVRTWQPGRLLEVDITSTPPSMEETSLYPHLHPAHLEGYMESDGARFELIPLPNGRTRLIGTSWYRNRMQPAFYWKWWTDKCIKAVQVHVLMHIKQLSEQEIHTTLASTASGAPLSESSSISPVTR